MKDNRTNNLFSLIESINKGAAVSDASPKGQESRKKRALTDFPFFVRTYFPHWCLKRDSNEIIPCASFHKDAAEYIAGNHEAQAVFMWARGHAKSAYMDVMIPMWLHARKDIHVMVLVGKSESNANKLLGDLQMELQNNLLYNADFGEQYNAGAWAEGQFVTQDDFACFALGRGQSPRGLRYKNHRPDYIVIDDLDDDELCQNDYRVRKLTEWVREALFGCFGADGGRFIMVGNLISKNSVLANIAKLDSVHVSRVNVLDENGQPSWPALWTLERVRANESVMGYRAFQKEFMNNPITEGAVFKHSWIKYAAPLPLNMYEYLVCYTDPSFKPTTKNDYKAAKLWGRTFGGELHHIDAFVRQCTTTELVRWLYDTYERITDAGAACNFYMEANFMQDMIFDEFEREGNIRGYQLPILADKRKKPDKFARIEAISPLWERGFVYYNEEKKGDPDFLVALEQTLAFQKGMSGHDDAPDADEGALFLLQQMGRSSTFQPMVRRLYRRVETI